jgi:Flp pilus assembly protein TadD
VFISPTAVSRRSGSPKPTEAERRFWTTLERNRSSVQTRTKLGVALSAASRLDDAARQLRTAVQADPENADAHYQLGRVLMKLGRSDEARGHLSQFERLREP